MGFNLYLFLTFLINVSTLSKHVESILYQGLNFNIESHKIVDILRIVKNDETIGQSLAIACPPHDSRELDFNLNYSFGKKSLFVRSVYGALIHSKEIEYRICSDIYKMSISYHRPTEELLFGYEIYFDSYRFVGIKTSDYSDFDSVINAFSAELKEVYLQTKQSEQKSNIPAPSKIQMKEPKDSLTPMGFVWLLSFNLKFNNEIKRPVKVTYTLTETTEIGIECTDYNLGNELYSDKEDYIDSLYKNQVAIFTHVDLPLKDLIRPEKNLCLTKYSLIPAEKFHSRFSEPTQISCSNLTTVPIWERTLEKVLRKLDKFLFALAKVTQAELKIISGVHGELGMPKMDSNEIKKIVLGENGEIPVPNIVYKVVKYDHSFVSGEKNGEKPKEEHTAVSKTIIIVAHNDPNFEKKDKMCPKSNCERLGWDEILYDHVPSYGPPSNYVYCCPKDRETMHKLGLEYENVNSEEFNLKILPQYADGIIAEFKDVREDVVDKMVELYGIEKDPDADRVTFDASQEYEIEKDPEADRVTFNASPKPNFLK